MNRRSVVASAALLLAMAVPAAAQNSGQLTSPSVATEGRASIKVTPDVAWLSVSAEFRAVRPADAQRQSAEAIDAVRNSLKKFNLKDDAVKTRAYSVEPQMQYAEGKSKVIGYVARQTLDVRVDTLTDLGAIIDAVGGSGATSVSDIRYDVKNRAEVESQALALAVKNGMARAETIAAAAGKTVLTLWRVDDQRLNDNMPRPMAFESFKTMAAASPATAIAPSDLEIVAMVSVTVIVK